MNSCRFCKKVLNQLNFYPHINNNLFKPGTDVSDIPSEMIEDMPKPHLHVYYECKECNYILAENDLPLLNDIEVDNYLKSGKLIDPKRTVEYWKNWLKNNKK